MLTTIPSRSTVFNANYVILGEYVQDDSRIPYYNAMSVPAVIEPGEPVAHTQGAGAIVCQAQSAIFPGEIGVLARYFIADLPCLFSANVLVGAEVYWDFTNKRVALAADVTNGFLLGYATWAIPPNVKGFIPTVSGTKIIAATSTSTRCRVVAITGATTVKGTVVIL